MAVSYVIRRSGPVAALLAKCGHEKIRGVALQLCVFSSSFVDPQTFVFLLPFC